MIFGWHKLCGQVCSWDGISLKWTTHFFWLQISVQASFLASIPPPPLSPEYLFWGLWAIRRYPSFPSKCMFKCFELWIWAFYLLEMLIQMWIEVVLSAELHIVKWMTTVQFWAEVQIFFFATVNTSWVHQYSYPVGTRHSFPWCKASSSWSWPLSSVEVRNSWNCTSTAQYIFMVWYLNMGTATVVLSVMFLAVCWVTCRRGKDLCFYHHVWALVCA